MEFFSVPLETANDNVLASWEVIENILSFILNADHFAIIISVIALCLSLKQEHRYSKKLDCKIKMVPIRSMYSIDANGDAALFPFKVTYSHLIDVLLINPSSAPITFFELAVLSDKNEILPFPVKAWFENLHLETVCCLTNDFSQDTHPIRLVPPPDIYGTIQPHSCLPMMLAINTNPKSKIMLSFKVCKAIPLKRGEPTTTHEYKTCEYLIDLSTPNNIIKLTSSSVVAVAEASRNGTFRFFKKTWRAIKRLLKKTDSKKDAIDL